MAKTAGTKTRVATVAHMQAADHRSPQRCILFASVAQPERHRHHADNHGQRRHADRPKAGSAGFDRRQNGVPVLG